MPKLNQYWKELLSSEFEKEYFVKLKEFVEVEYETQEVYPPADKVFAAFDTCIVENTKVVIIGQDPYHGKGQANGLSFSVADGVRIPPSLVNIYKEIATDLGKEIPTSGNLERWAKQGVLLLNSTLTVRAKSPGSHQKKGWEQFTNAVIEKISSEKDNLVFMLWGAFAKNKRSLIANAPHHLILEAAHPSPFSARKGFFGCKHFSKANTYLKQNGNSPIEW